MPWTNNNIEGFNNAFSKNVAQYHPNIWKCISFLKKEEILVKTKILPFERGDGSNNSKKYKNVNDRIKRTVELYDEDDKIKFFSIYCI